jgi:hypothetical protein
MIINAELLTSNPFSPLFLLILVPVKKKSLLFWAGLLLVIALGIRLFAANASRVENSYANGIYPPISAFLRLLIGWIPISVGDILYGIILVWVTWKLVKFIRALFKKQMTRDRLARGFIKTVMAVLVLYIVFNALWGINYNRSGIAAQLQLKMDKYSIEDLQHINALLLQKVNASKGVLLGRHEAYPNSRQLFDKVKDAYAGIDSTYPFLKYHTASIKPSLWGWLGNYLGFIGYYNPFTGEAQVNTTVPDFLQPYTCCHEVAHQLGYAKEMEANFVGYLAASSSKDTLLHYSVYLDLFLYSNRNLYGSDSVSARTYARQLLPEVKNDIAEWRRFNRRHRNPAEPVFRWLYGKYLENNEQPQGVLSYDEVTSFLIAYNKKFGKI